jgi:hypothetical protein
VRKDDVGAGMLSLLGLIGQETVIAPRVGGKFGRRVP